MGRNDGKRTRIITKGPNGKRHDIDRFNPGSDLRFRTPISVSGEVARFTPKRSGSTSLLSFRPVYDDP